MTEFNWVITFKHHGQAEYELHGENCACDSMLFFKQEHGKQIEAGCITDVLIEHYSLWKARREAEPHD
jgi:hypothetical protein